MYHSFKVIVIISIAMLIASCSASVDSSPIGPPDDDDNPPSNVNPEWAVSPIFGAGSGKDGIVAISDPILVQASQVDFLDEDDLVIGVEIGGAVRAYPHKLMDWHEIVNDVLGGEAIAVTYCPLTGTAIGWKRTIDGVETTFGVSGLLHNSNLIPYDRETNSNWSQILNESVQGELSGKRVELFNVVETTWKTWREFYPMTEVVALQQGLDNTIDYAHYPYGNYREQNDVFFPLTNTDNRLHKKERVLGIIVRGDKKAYTIKSFSEGIKVMRDNIGGESIVIAGSASQNFAVAYKSKARDGILLLFSNTENTQGIMEDNEGNVWDVNGRAVSGPRTGELLERVESFIGYWFGFGAFYPDIKLDSTDDDDNK